MCLCGLEKTQFRNELKSSINAGRYTADYLSCGNLPYPAREMCMTAHLSYRRIRRYLVWRLKRLEARDFSHVRFTNGELLVDRSCADGWSVGTSRSVLKVSEKSLDVHIFSDQSSLEIFTDQYRNNHSNNIFAGNDQDAISISAFGGRAVIRDYEAYGLQECFNWIK